MLAALPHIATADDQGSDDGTHHPTDHETLVTFHTRLTGDQQSPPVTTAAFGFAEARLFQNGTSSAIEFRVVVCNITNVTHSHIHVGAIGTNGNIIVHFFDQPSTPVSSPDGCATLAHGVRGPTEDRKSTRLNSSHLVISYAVFCLKKKRQVNAAERG